MGLFSIFTGRSRKGRRLGRFLIPGILVAGIAAAALVAKPAYRIFREHRIDKNLDSARQAMRTEDWNEAKNKSLSVLRARQNDFEALRIYCRAQAEQEEPGTYGSAIRLFIHPEADDDDRIWALRILATQAPHALTLGAFQSLPDDKRELPDFRAAITPLLVVRGQAAMAEKALREVMGNDPSPLVRSELIRTICAQRDSWNVDEAREHFAELIARDASREGLDALLLLGETKGGLAPGKPIPDHLETWVGRQPKRRTLHLLYALHPAIESSPDVANRMYQEAVDRYSEVDPGQLGTWLIRHNRPEQALEMLEVHAKDRGDAFIARLHALMRLDRLDELKAALAEPPATADKVELEIVRAIVAGREGDTVTANASWTQALNEASYDTRRNRFLVIARTAERQQARRASEDAWVGAIRSGWGPLPLYQDIKPLLDSLADQGRTEDLLAIHRTMIRLEPDNPLVLNQFLYLALLHEAIPPAEAVQRFTGLMAKYPDKPEFSAGLILAELLDNRTDEAISHLPLLEKADSVPAGLKSLLASIARIHGDSPEAADSIPDPKQWATLMPQEQKIFRTLITRQSKQEIKLPAIDTPAEQINPDEVPAWRKALERLERERPEGDVPSLPPAEPDAERQTSQTSPDP